MHTFALDAIVFSGPSILFYLREKQLNNGYLITFFVHLLSEEKFIIPQKLRR